jgi:hypothetical protein
VLYLSIKKMFHMDPHAKAADNAANLEERVRMTPVDAPEDISY